MFGVKIGGRAVRQTVRPAQGAPAVQLGGAGGAPAAGGSASAGQPPLSADTLSGGIGSEQQLDYGTPTVDIFERARAAAGHQKYELKRERLDASWLSLIDDGLLATYLEQRRHTRNWATGLRSVTGFAQQWCEDTFACDKPRHFVDIALVDLNCARGPSG